MQNRNVKLTEAMEEWVKFGQGRKIQMQPKWFSRNFDGKPICDETRRRDPDLYEVKLIQDEVSAVFPVGSDELDDLNRLFREHEEWLQRKLQKTTVETSSWSKAE